MSILTIENVHMYFQNKKGFGKHNTVKAVTDVSLEIDQGEIIAIVGESGCGKTTLGKMIAGVLTPTMGNIIYEGEDIKRIKKDQFHQYRLGVQMVHQDSYAALNPNRKIIQSLMAPILRHKIVKDKKEGRKVLYDLLTEVGLIPPDQILDKYPHQLSGGQRQRILLARALSVQPKLIVADEPVSMVDVSLRISLLDLMAQMNKKFNISFIYITHDLATARYIAQYGKLVTMYLGKIIEMGPIQNCIDNPKHPYLKALVAAVPSAKEHQKGKLPLRSLDMPDSSNLPSGCAFHPRCPYWTDVCEKVCPQLRMYEGAMVSCHNIEKI